MAKGMTNQNVPIHGRHLVYDTNLRYIIIAVPNILAIGIMLVANGHQISDCREQNHVAVPASQYSPPCIRATTAKNPATSNVTTGVSAAHNIA